MASYLITGSSRGLALGIIIQLISFPRAEVGTIFASTRKQSPDLAEIVEKSDGRVVFIQLDVTNEESIKKAVKEVEGKLDGRGLDVLINNVGMMENTPGGVAKMDDLTQHFSVNVLSAHYMIRNFLPLLELGNEKKIVNITSTLGSITQANKYTWGSTPGYKITKAALNMLTVQYSLEYAKQGFTIFALSPGWIRTELGGEHADLSVEVGSAATLKKIMGATKEDTGSFLNIHVKGYEKVDGPNQYDGLNPPW